MTEDERRKKSILITVLVAFLAIIIFLFWFLNLKNVIEANRLRSQNNEDAAKWNQLKADIGKSLNDVNQKLSEQAQQNQLQENVNGVLNGVMEQAGKIASSSATSSSELNISASSTNATSSAVGSQAAASSSSSTVNNNCPSYIDCMPTIGAAKSCQIPAGCEGITQIAY